jgi:nitrate reductase gamma subunit
MTLTDLLNDITGASALALRWAYRLPTQIVRLWQGDQILQFHGDSFLDFVRGPALQAASLIMIVGVVWRLCGILLLRRRPNQAAARHGLPARLLAGGALMITRFVPRRTFWAKIAVSVVLSTVFHIGLMLILFGGAPHILLIHQMTGVGWPNLPKGVVVLVSGLTLAALIAVLVRRIGHPVLRLLSTTDDYLSWLMVFLPVLTGILLSGEAFASYATLLALHILSVELMMIWLPFGKLMHVVLVFASRGAMGVNFARKGAAT